MSYNAANVINEAEKNYLVSFVLKFSFKILLDTTSYNNLSGNIRTYQHLKVCTDMFPSIVKTKMLYYKPGYLKLPKRNSVIVLMACNSCCAPKDMKMETTGK